MNSNVHPAVVVLVLVLTGIAIGVWMWGSNEAASIGGPAELKSDHRGHIFLQIQNSLIEHDATGRYIQTHDLEGLGVELFLGSFDFFSNGDVSLRRGADPRSFGDNLRALGRQTNKASLTPESAESGLYRCNLAQRHCGPFSDPAFDFKAAYGVHIDRQSDTVYITDTTRHLLRIYSASGVELHEPVAGFHFPNQVFMHENTLLIANTNHHEIQAFDTARATLEEALTRHSVTPDIAKSERQIWPSHFARVGDMWWVNNMRSGMNEGGLYVFDDEWQFVRKLAMPDDADPIALIAVDNTVWVSDWNGDKVRRFTPDGEALVDLESAGLADLVSRSIAERWCDELVGYSGVLLLLLVLGGLLVRGFAVSMSRSGNS